MSDPRSGRRTTVIVGAAATCCAIVAASVMGLWSNVEATNLDSVLAFALFLTLLLLPTLVGVAVTRMVVGTRWTVASITGAALVVFASAFRLGESTPNDLNTLFSVVVASGISFVGSMIAAIVVVVDIGLRSGSDSAAKT